MNIHQKDKLHFQIERLAFFSDAVIAIALTLLIIEIKAPHIPDGANLDEQLHQLQELFPEFISFFISFGIIISQWIKHHWLFGKLINYDKKLITVNSCFLFTIAIIPFSTSYFAHNNKPDFFLPYVFYGFNLISLTVLNFLLFKRIVTEKNNLFDKSLNKYQIKWLIADYLLLPTAILSGLIVGYFNISIGLITYVIIILFSFYIDKKKKSSN